MGIPIARPRRSVAGFRKLTPDKSFSIFGPLIPAASVDAVHRQQHRDTNKKKSPVHNFCQKTTHRRSSIITFARNFRQEESKVRLSVFVDRSGERFCKTRKQRSTPNRPISNE